jgi:hypothetical protein
VERVDNIMVYGTLEDFLRYIRLLQ